LTQGSEGEGDRAVAQFNIASLMHNAVCVGDGKVGEVAMVFFEAVGALCIGFVRHLSAEISKLLAELLDLSLGLEMLEGSANGCVGEANGNGAQSPSIEVGVPLHDIE
jgi:hypothetical protein